MLKAIRWQQIVLALIGLAVAGFALRIPERWVDFQPGSPNQLLLLLFGLLLAALGIMGNQFPISGLQKAYQTGTVVLLNTVLLLLVIELVATLSVNLKYQVVLQGQVIADNWDIRPELPYFQRVDWGATYWREHQARRTEYQSYVVWRHLAQTGETINIDDRGVRLTPGATCVEGAYRVFMFGGSTLWGEGSP
ncbi:MAG: hypothetical protein H7X77_03700, partial [Anaerolineae bacterium]|nr:hypothetical protein [Anaerolineae bacterium]